MQKCNYCAFLSFNAESSPRKEYTDALVQEIRCRGEALGHPEVDTVYVGGGTPSVLDLSQMRDIMTAVSESFSVKPDAEMTIEANPGTLGRKDGVTLAKLQAYKYLGFNRLSMGVQSMENDRLHFLGRIHTAENVARDMELIRRKGFENLVKRGIEGLVIIGGDGSLTGGSLLSKETGLPIVGLPGTIDNDVWGMDYTIGCDTAANTIVDAINKLRDTASAHRRIMLVEVMGRNSGWLAMMSGIAGGAEFVLVPEVKFNIDSMCEEIKAMYDAGKRYSIIVVAEGAGSAIEIGKAVEEKTGIDTRVSVLGHIQRGGSPTVEDRMKASMLGEKAALAIISGASDIVFGFNEGKVVGVNLFEAVNNTKTLNPELVRLARVLA